MTNPQLVAPLRNIVTWQADEITSMAIMMSYEAFKIFCYHKPSRRTAPKICQGQPTAMYSDFIQIGSLSADLV